MAGYDGGLPQKFILEVYHGDVDFLSSSQPLYNVSNADEPSFSLAGLEASVEAGVHVAVYAVNAKGRSQPVVLSEVTYRDAEKRTGKIHAFLSLSPFLFFRLACSCVERTVSVFSTLPYLSLSSCHPCNNKISTILADIPISDRSLRLITDETLSNFFFSREISIDRGNRSRRA